MVELLVTIIIAGVVFAAMIPFLASAQSRNAADNMRNIALQVARDKIEKIRQLDYDSVDTTYLNDNGPPTLSSGVFGTEWQAGTGGALKDFRITYNVTLYPLGSTAGQESYKTVSVSVVWEGAPFPHKAVVLQTTVSRQYFGPQVVDLFSPDASPGTEGLDELSGGGSSVRIIATVASQDLAQLTGSPKGKVVFAVTDMSGNLVASGSQDTPLSTASSVPTGVTGQFQWLWDSSTASTGYYIFTAHAESGGGAVGNTWSITYSVVSGGLAAPTNLAANQGDQNVSLTWTAVSGADHYQVWRSAASGAESLLQDNVLSPAYVDQGLTNGTTYYYKVRAIAANGSGGALSSEVSATPSASSDTTPPTDPSNLTMTDHTTTSISLAWSPSTDDVGVESYEIWRSTSVSGSYGMVGTVQGAPLTPPQASYIDSTGLAAGTTYYYKILARDGSNNPSGYSPVAAFSTSLNPTYGTMTVTNSSNGNVTMSVTVFNLSTKLYYSANGSSSATPVSVNISNKSPNQAAWTPLPTGDYTVNATADTNRGTVTKTQSPVSITTGANTTVSFSF
jgi:fibronectin type 3 domain-containing protein